MAGAKKVQHKKASSRPTAKAHPAAVASVDRKRLEEELAQNNEFLQRLLESNSVCAVLKDEEGRYVYANKAMERHFPRLLGKTDADLFPAHLARQLREHDLTALMTNAVSKFDETTEGGGGALQWMSLKFPLTLSSGRKLLVALCFDVTKQKKIEEQLRESEERYRTIADLASDYAFVFQVHQGKTLALEWMSPSFSRISGLTMEEMLDRSGWKKLPHPEDSTVLQQHREAVLSGQEQTCEFRIIAKSGEVRWLHETLRPVWDREQQRVVRIYGAGQDITERKRMSEQLQGREIRPKDLGMNLRRFRQKLGLTQAIFGQTFGGYSQRQITSYETGEIEIPMGLLLTIRQKGYPLEVVLGESQADALDKVVGYLSASWRIHETAKRLTESVLRLLDRESETITSIMSRLGIAPENEATRETFTLREMLRRAGIESSLSPETEEEPVA